MLSNARGASSNCSTANRNDFCKNADLLYCRGQAHAVFHKSHCLARNRQILHLILANRLARQQQQQHAVERTRSLSFGGMSFIDMMRAVGRYARCRESVWAIRCVFGFTTPAEGDAASRNHPEHDHAHEESRSFIVRKE